ncbi:thioredoxin reductase [Ruminiclostridium sufflavum DSM 19573]|uniref:Thioredoxin reductase n=1 Tax=Ruminiclostridium sufflavum DSM 19573 TaxID=1121337 RepID=A0A318XR16_9FIRM|nr:FAD-dependent oxidoreductase [Ruminiclostridium sufflavum]PYG89856.1 thioredoxin reductase [Ruminiclostridium sufflavum DSM 19573]
MLIKKDIIIVGAGPAGLAAAIEAKKRGRDGILVLERELSAGGILNQCIHDGFGLIRFNEALTGPEYARRYIDEAKALGIEIVTNVMVQDISRDKTVTAVSPDGIKTYKAEAVILAMGCRERTRGAICIPGTRPSGVFTAGVAQNLVNLKNIMVGKRIVILGSGDIGLIMARRLTLEGAKVLAVVEKLPYSSGLQRNITQCLDDFEIPLLLSHTVTKIEGHERVKGVTIARVDEKGNSIRGTSRKFECDTLILSVGLIPENEVSLNAGIVIDETTGGARVDENLQTSVPGIFACGNVLQVHDLVDYVSAEGEQAAKAAVEFIKGRGEAASDITVRAGSGIRYVLPQSISSGRDITFSMRVTNPCKNKTIIFKDGDTVLKKRTFKALNPAEMVRIDLKAGELRGVLNMEVFIDG